MTESIEARRKYIEGYRLCPRVGVDLKTLRAMDILDPRNYEFPWPFQRIISNPPSLNCMRYLQGNKKRFICEQNNICLERKDLLNMYGGFQAGDLGEFALRVILEKQGHTGIVIERPTVAIVGEVSTTLLLKKQSETTQEA